MNSAASLAISLSSYIPTENRIKRSILGCSAPLLWVQLIMRFFLVPELPLSEPLKHIILTERSIDDYCNKTKPLNTISGQISLNIGRLNY